MEVVRYKLEKLDDELTMLDNVRAATVVVTR